MEKENELDDFLGNVNNDFSQNDEKNPLEVESTEEHLEETTQEVEEKEEKLPFNKDPKVQRFIEKELSKRLAGIEERINQVSNKGDKDEEEDDFYVRLIGNDTPEKIAFIKEAKLREERREQRAAETAYQKLLEEKQREEAEIKQVEETLYNSIEEIEENYGVDLTSKDPVVKKTRVDFLKYVEKVAPKDANGEILYLPDMNATFETFQELRKKASTAGRAKDLASRGTSRSGDVLSTPTQRITFDNIDELIKNNL